GISVMPNAAVVFSSIESGTTTLWIMNEDGSRRRPFLRHPFSDGHPVAFSGGVAYVSVTANGTDLCVSGTDGEERRVVISHIDDAPIAVSPDGKYFIYSINRRLWKISADGQQRQELTQGVASNPSYSPTGQSIAFVSGDKLIVVTADGIELWRGALRQGGANGLRWTDDGNALL